MEPKEESELYAKSKYGKTPYGKAGTRRYILYMSKIKETCKDFLFGYKKAMKNQEQQIESLLKEIAELHAKNKELQNKLIETSDYDFYLNKCYCDISRMQDIPKFCFVCTGKEKIGCKILQEDSQNKWRTLLRVSNIDDNSNVSFIIPAWNIDEVVVINLKDIPSDLHNSIVVGARLHAKVNLNANIAKELVFTDWEKS